MAKYSKRKIAITVDKELVEKIDKIKDFPRWKGNRSAIFEEALELLILTEGSSTCIFCNKTDKSDFIDWKLVNRKKGGGVCKDCFDFLEEKGWLIKEPK